MTENIYEARLSPNNFKPSFSEMNRHYLTITGHRCKKITEAEILLWTTRRISELLQVEPRVFWRLATFSANVFFLSTKVQPSAHLTLTRVRSFGHFSTPIWHVAASPRVGIHLNDLRDCSTWDCGTHIAHSG